MKRFIMAALAASLMAGCYGQIDMGDKAQARAKAAPPVEKWTGAKWEYARAYFPEVDQCNEMGEQGWEAVAASQNFVYFKRPKH